MRATWHWIWSCVWAEIGVAFDSRWALDRAVVHLEAWMLLVLPAEASEMFALRVMRAARERTR